MIKVSKDSERSIDGIVFGRVDFVGSLGLDRGAIESEKITNSVLQVSKKCKEIDIDLIVGGAVSYDARENLRKFKSVHLSRFETRKIIFDSKSLDNENLEQALKDAVHFELLWLFNKREYYSNINKEDDKRIDMLEARWRILENQ